MPRLRQPKEAAPAASVLFGEADKEEPKVVKQEEAEGDDGEVALKLEPEKSPETLAADELKKQIEALKRGEAEQRRRADQAEREREEARREALDRTTETKRALSDATQARLDFISKTIEKESEAAESAERAVATAMAEGDAVAAAKAQRRLAQAEAQLLALNNGKAAIESEIQEAKTQAEAPKKEEPRQQQATVEQVIDSWNVPSTAKQWLKAHQDYVTDPRKNTKIQALHWDIQDEGHAPYSEAYFHSMEVHLGMRDTDEPESERNSIVSAPVSREVPGNNGKRQSGTITLSLAQREAAKASGVTEAEYAKQLVKLRAEKEAGNYRESR